MKFQTFEFILPAYWASYLINGDSSALKESEIAACDKFTDANGVSGHAADCGESFFHWRNDSGNGLRGDVCEFTFLVPEKEVKSESN